jgi:Flp pilus assembly protein TadD
MPARSIPRERVSALAACAPVWLVVLLVLAPGWISATAAQDAVPQAPPSARDAWLDGDDDETDGEESIDTTPRADLAPARALVRDQKLDEAAATLEALRGEFPEDGALLLLLGEVHVASGQFDAAIDVLRRAAELEPERDRIHFQLGTAYANTGRRDEALEAFGAELTRSEDPQVLVLARINRSLLLQRANRWAEAAEELEGVLQFEPDRTNVYGDLASLCVQAGDADRARRALERGAAVGFRSAAHWYSVGARLFNDERLDDAAAAFEQALAIDPTRPDAHRSLAATLDRLGRGDDAATHYRKYLEFKPDAPDAEAIRAKLGDG